MHGALGRLFAAAVTVLALTTIASPAAAQTRDPCTRSAQSLEEDRAALAQLQAVVDTAKADRQTLRNRADELTRRIETATSDAQARQLQADRKAALEEIATIESLLPPIEAQTRALTEQIAAATESLAACETP